MEAPLLKYKEEIEVSVVSRRVLNPSGPSVFLGVSSSCAAWPPFGAALPQASSLQALLGGHRSPGRPWAVSPGVAWSGVGD